jgi:hypothetical protein
MLRLISLALAATIAVTPAVADEFTDTVDSALAAYKANDLKVAREELDYALTLLHGMKSETLGKLLPEPLAGWTRTASADAGAAAGAMGMFGGGTTASATYTRGAEDITVTLVADSPVVTGIGGMLAGLAGATGTPLRINRTQFSDTGGDLQGVVDGKVMVSVAGSAAQEDKVALIESMDFDALADF